MTSHSGVTVGSSKCELSFDLGLIGRGSISIENRFDIPFGDDLRTSVLIGFESG